MRRPFLAALGVALAAPIVGAFGASDAARQPGVSAGSSDGTVEATVLVSRQLADQEHIAAGDVIELSSDASESPGRSFRVTGIYEPVPDPLRFTARRLEVRLHLPDLLALTDESGDPLARESVTAINVALADASEAETYVRDVAGRMPTLVARPAAPESARIAPFVTVERFHFAIGVVTILGSATFLLALMVMLAEERRETVGTLRLIGLSRSRVLRQVLAEGLMIAAAGALFGLVVALATEDLVNRFFQWKYDTPLVFVRVTPRVAWRTMASSVPLGVLASLVASWTLLRRPILELVRR